MKTKRTTKVSSSEIAIRTLSTLFLISSGAYLYTFSQTGSGLWQYLMPIIFSTFFFAPSLITLWMDRRFKSLVIATNFFLFPLQWLIIQNWSPILFPGTKGPIAVWFLFWLALFYFSWAKWPEGETRPGRIEKLEADIYHAFFERGIRPVYVSVTISSDPPDVFKDASEIFEVEIWLEDTYRDQINIAYQDEPVPEEVVNSYLESIES